MLKSLFNEVMERRARDLVGMIGTWLPVHGPVLDIGSGTGHPAARVERERNIEVVTTDVTDMHITGRTPVMITEHTLPFDANTFSAALLLFMLHYPPDPVAILADAARVTHGPIIVVQSLYNNRFGFAWLRVREFVWSYVAFHISRAIGYVPARSQFTMHARRFYTPTQLMHAIGAAGLRVSAKRERPVLPGNALVVACWMLEPDA